MEQFKEKDVNILRITMIRSSDTFTVKSGDSINNFRSSKGFYYLTEILSQPNVEIPNIILVSGNYFIQSSEIEKHYAAEDPDNFEIVGYYVAYCENSLPLTDNKTVIDCKKRINHLNSKLAYLKAKKNPDCRQEKEIEKEKKAILAYLQETYNSALNRIKHSRSECDRINHNLNENIRRSLKILNEQCGEIKIILNSVLERKYCCSVYRPRSDVEIDVLIRR